MIVSFIGSFAGVLFLFMVAYRSLRVHVTAGVSLGVGVTLSFGAAALALGFRMTALAAAFGAILAGLGIDYPIHLYHRFREEAAAGRAPGEAVRASLAGTGPGIVSAALTTALAFGLLALADFRGMVEVGVFVGLGMLAMLAAMLTVLPALLLLVEGRRSRFESPRSRGFGIGWLERAVGRAGLLLAAPPLLLAAAAAVDLGFRGAPAFETDMRNLQPFDAEATRANDAIRDHFGISLNPILAVTRASTREGALAAAADVEARLEPLFAEGTLAYAAGPGAFLPGPLRTARGRGIAGALDPDRAIRDLEEALARHDFEPEAFRAPLERMREALRVVSGKSAAGDAAASFAPLLEPFAAKDGEEHLAVTALYAPHGAGTEAHLETGRRVRELAGDSLGPRGVVTSMDLLVHRLKARITKELASITGLVVAAVLLVVALHFRRPLPFLLALLPLACGFVLTLGGMKAFGIRMNFMNAVVLPMILGIGVDNGIHLVHRWRTERAAGRGWREALLGAGLPIVMSAATTIWGFGSLVLTDNPGLRSIGWVAILGIGSCMLTALLVLPPAFRWMDGRRAAANVRPPAAPGP
jgi:predicted exporter